MFIVPEGKLRDFLAESGRTEMLDGFHLVTEQEELLAGFREEALTTLPDASPEEREAWATFCAATHPGRRVFRVPQEAEPPLPQGSEEIRSAVASIRGSVLKVAVASKGLEAAVAELPSSMAKVQELTRETVIAAEGSQQLVKETADAVRKSVATHVKAAEQSAVEVHRTIGSIQKVTRATKELVDEAQRVILSFPEGPITVIRSKKWEIGLEWAWRVLIAILLATILLVVPARGQDEPEVVEEEEAAAWAPEPLSIQDREALKNLQLEAYQKLVQIKNKYAESKDYRLKAAEAESEALKLEFELRDINDRNGGLQRKLVMLYQAVGFKISSNFEWIREDLKK